MSSDKTSFQPYPPYKYINNHFARASLWFYSFPLIEQCKSKRECGRKMKEEKKWFKHFFVAFLFVFFRGFIAE